MISFLFLVFLQNRKKLFDYPEVKEFEGISIVMPCYNEGEVIGEAIEALLDLDYPKDKIEIIVVDDRSKDNSAEIVKNYASKYSNVKLIVNSRNSGGAAEPTNLGIKAAKYDYIAVADADSMPKKDALKKMLGFLQQDEKVGGVTCSVLVRNPKTFMQKLQAIEYASIAFSRKLLDMVDGVYVTPGPFALYRKKILLEVGLFDVNNLTQDIEIVWRLLKRGYVARMSLATSVYSHSPTKFREWARQRIRWIIGGTQTLWKYKKYTFREKMLGLFVIPFFAISTFLGLMGLFVFGYLIFKRFLSYYLVTKYSIYGGTALLYLQDINFAPSILNYFGAVMFLLGAFFTFFGLYLIKDKELGDKKFISIPFYMIVYLTIYPVLLIVALYKMAIGKYSW
ncbi:MAG: glycosyltransferase [Nanoarchaeota archaeon]